MAIPQHFLDDLIERTDLVDFFESQGVHLKKTGATYMARCPFHNEKTPSFSVSPSKHLYHCFGCSQSGTAITYLREKNGYTFLEAVKFLADRLGLEIPDDRKFSPAERKRYQEAKDKKNRILLTLKKAATFYYQNLKTSDIAKNYCKNRGLTGLTAQQFGIGFSPDSWNGLAQVFPDYERNQDLIDAGLVKIGERGRFDFFRGRLMIPILNVQGEVIGFGARVLKKEDEKKGGKYINSPETAVFEKGKELFGLCQAQKALAAENCAIVCEGYLDVMMLNQWGVLNALAALGTATTSFHIRKLLRYVDKIIFSFDGDAAGRKAAWRALDNALPELRDSKRIFFIFLPEGEDPDSFVRQYGKDAFADFLKNAEPLSAFLLRHFEEECGLDSPESRAQFLAAVKGSLAKLAAPLLKSQLIKAVAELTYFKEEEVQSAVDSAAAELATREESAPHFQNDGFPPFDSFEMASPEAANSDSVRQRKNDNLTNYWHGLLKSILMNPQNIEEAKTSALPQWMDENPCESSMDFLLLSHLLKLTRDSWDAPLELEEVEKFVQNTGNAALYQHFIAIKRDALELKTSRPFADLLSNLQSTIAKNKKRKKP